MPPGISIHTEFLRQWRNPSDVLTILMIIGGEIVQTALAQMTGPAFVPVAFSFGWVAYSFTTLVSLIGDGRLMPVPDYPCKLINASNGYVRDNKSWVLSRLLRDDAQPLADEGLVISVYEAREKDADRHGNDTDRPAPHGKPRRGQLDVLSVLTVALQLVLAALPWILRGEPEVFVITVWGTALALLTGGLPQWRVEKYPCRDIAREDKPYRKDVILTQGNGSRYAMLIISDGCGLDMEDLAAGEGPRVARPWEKHGIFVKRHGDEEEKGAKGDGGGKQSGNGNGNGKVPKAQTLNWRKLPRDFWLTRFLCAALAMGWIALLISVAGLRQNSWFLLLVGAIGMVQNAAVAGATRTSEKKGIYLKQVDLIRGGKVMDALMDLEWSYPGAGFHMLGEFFPAGLKEKYFEPDWWKGQTKEYDAVRHLPKNSWREAARSTRCEEKQPALKDRMYEVTINAHDRKPVPSTTPAPDPQASAGMPETGTD